MPPMQSRPFRILVLCDKGISRSVTLAGQLKFLGNDVLTAGFDVNNQTTLRMLDDWADLTILTNADQESKLPLLSGFDYEHYVTWDMGDDSPETTRPYNPIMLKRAKEHIRTHKDEVDHRPSKT